jgi:hypothetical protein
MLQRQQGVSNGDQAPKGSYFQLYPVLAWLEHPQVDRLTNRQAFMAALDYKHTQARHLYPL